MRLGPLQLWKSWGVVFTLMGHLRGPAQLIELVRWGYDDAKGMTLRGKGSVCLCNAFVSYDGANRRAVKNRWRSEELGIGSLSWQHFSSLKGMPQGAPVDNSEVPICNRRGVMRNSPFLGLNDENGVRPHSIARGFQEHGVTCMELNHGGIETETIDETWLLGRESVLAAVDALKKGKFVCVTDDVDRENEGDLIIAAEMATPEALVFMIRYSSGIICVGMPKDRCDALDLPDMVVNNTDPKMTAFTVSVDAVACEKTGISAMDRSITLRALANDDASPGDFTRPGHIFPLIYQKGGVLSRPGHTEASVDLAKLAGLAPMGVISEIVSSDGLNMARGEELSDFCSTHGLVQTSIRDLRCYLREQRT